MQDIKKEKKKKKKTTRESSRGTLQRCSSSSGDYQFSFFLSQATVRSLSVGALAVCEAVSYFFATVCSRLHKMLLICCERQRDILAFSLCSPIVCSFSLQSQSPPAHPHPGGM